MPKSNRSVLGLVLGLVLVVMMLSLFSTAAVADQIQFHCSFQGSSEGGTSQCQAQGTFEHHRTFSTEVNTFDGDQMTIACSNSEGIRQTLFEGQTRTQYNHDAMGLLLEAVTRDEDTQSAPSVLIALDSSVWDQAFPSQLSYGVDGNAVTLSGSCLLQKQ